MFGRRAAVSPESVPHTRGKFRPVLRAERVVAVEKGVVVAGVCKSRVPAFGAGQKGGEVRLVLRRDAEPVRHFVQHGKGQSRVRNVGVHIALAEKWVVYAGDPEPRQNARRDHGLGRRGRAFKNRISPRQCAHGVRRPARKRGVAAAVKGPIRPARHVFRRLVGPVQVMLRRREQLLLRVVPVREADAAGKGRSEVVESPREQEKAERARAGEAAAAGPVRPSAPRRARPAAQSQYELCQKRGRQQIDAQLRRGHARDERKNASQRARNRLGHGPVIRRHPVRVPPRRRVCRQAQKQQSAAHAEADGGFLFLRGHAAASSLFTV